MLAHTVPVFCWQSQLLSCNHVCKRPRLLFWVSVNVMTLCAGQQKIIATNNAVLSSLLWVLSVWWDTERSDAVLCAAFEMCCAVKDIAVCRYMHTALLCVLSISSLEKKKDIKFLFLMRRFTKLSLGGSIASQVDWVRSKTLQQASCLLNWEIAPVGGLLTRSWQSNLQFFFIAEEKQHFDTL